MARAMANVGTWVGFVQPGSLSLVHVGSARAARTRVTVSAIVFVAAVVPMWMRLDMWWAMVYVNVDVVCCCILKPPTDAEMGAGTRGGDMCGVVGEARNIRFGVLTVSMCRRAASVVVWDGGQGE
jgi:hypothetical protein